ncbi:hypothetical protein EBB07_33905 [Paenibacillaceae bacterium]|nr:hypothetical protein EBB07_33905 [Paenibacillaceae bacterium]
MKVVFILQDDKQDQGTTVELSQEEVFALLSVKNVSYSRQLSSSSYSGIEAEVKDAKLVVSSAGGQTLSHLEVVVKDKGIEPKSDLIT